MRELSLALFFANAAAVNCYALNRCNYTA